MSDYPSVDQLTDAQAKELVVTWQELRYNTSELARAIDRSRDGATNLIHRACQILGVDRDSLRASAPPAANPKYEAQCREAVAAWEAAEHNGEDAADSLEIPRSTFRRRLRDGLRKAKRPHQPLAPAVVPEGMRIRKSTVQYDAAGNVVNEWRRLGTDAEELQAVADRLCSIADGRRRKLPKLPTPRPHASDDLMLEIPLFDRHFGMYAWGKETGHDFDLDIAYKLVVGQTKALCERAASVGTALVVIGGDWFHADNRRATTERGGNALDVDTRQGKVWDVATSAIVDSIAIAGKMAPKVKLVIIPGNHDWESGFHLGRLMSAWYRSDPRVEVIHGPRSRHYYQHGSVLIGFAHGHLLGMSSLAGLMADEVPDLWAATRTRVWHLGHIHHTKKLSYMSALGDRSVEIEYLETTTSPDAWHHENGFVGSPRRGVSFTWSAKSGLVSRDYISADEILRD